MPLTWESLGDATPWGICPPRPSPKTASHPPISGADRLKRSANIKVHPPPPKVAVLTRAPLYRWEFYRKPKPIRRVGALPVAAGGDKCSPSSIWGGIGVWKGIWAAISHSRLLVLLSTLAHISACFCAFGSMCFLNCPPRSHHFPSTGLPPFSCSRPPERKCSD